MDFLLLAVALGSALAAGLGVAFAVVPERGRWLERASLCVPLGFGFVAVASWLVGCFASGAALRVTVLAACFMALVAGLRRARASTTSARGREPNGLDRPTVAFLVLAVTHTAVIAYLALTSQLNWDGLLVWEFKGRAAAMNEGVLPPEYFTDPSRNWTHPYYPPLYAMLVAWIYGWLGHPDQQLVKCVFPALHAALLGMLFVGGRRLGGPRVGLAAPVLLIVVPEVVFGEGGALSGLLDYSVAAYFLPAAVYVALLWSGDTRALPPLAAVCAVLPLIKQEGVVLWAVIVVLAAIGVVLFHPRRLLWMLSPGLIVFVAWRVHLVHLEAHQNVAFTPTVEHFVESLDKVPVILLEMLRELGRWGVWSALWPGVVVAVPGLLRRRRTDAVLLVALVAPVALLAASYVVSNWNLLQHVQGSLSRILVQVAPVAALVFALGLPHRREAPPLG